MTKGDISHLLEQLMAPFLVLNHFQIITQTSLLTFMIHGSTSNLTSTITFDNLFIPSLLS
jgi:hypothetical protein